MNKVEIIRANGEIAEIPRPRSLESLYEALNCTTVERVKVLDYRDKKLKYLWVDEDGYANRKQPNLIASRMYQGGTSIAGDAMLFTGWQGPKS